VLFTFQFQDAVICSERDRQIDRQTEIKKETERGSTTDLDSVFLAKRGNGFQLSGSIYNKSNTYGMACSSIPKRPCSFK
jgi:hypothetical protein